MVHLFGMAQQFHFFIIRHLTATDYKNPWGTERKSSFASASSIRGLTWSGHLLGTTKSALTNLTCPNSDTFKLFFRAYMRSVREVAGHQRPHNLQLLRVCPPSKHVAGIFSWMRMLPAVRSWNKEHSGKNETIIRKKCFKTFPFTLRQDREDAGSSLASLFKSFRRPYLPWLKFSCLAL